MDGAQRAAPLGAEPHPGPGLRHLGLQDRRRRARARGGREAALPRVRRRRRDGRRRRDRCRHRRDEVRRRGAVRGRFFIDCSGDGDLAAWAGAPYEVGDGKGNMLYPVAHVPHQRRRPREGRRGLEDDPAAHGGGRGGGHARFPRKKPIVRPQRNPLEWRANLTQIRNADGTAVTASTLRSSPTARSRAGGSAGTRSSSSAR